MLQEQLWVVSAVHWRGGAVDLSITAAREANERAGIDASLIDEAIVGNVLSAGLGRISLAR